MALTAILLLALTTIITSRLAGREAGLIAGLAMAMAPQYLFQSIMMHPDMYFAFFQVAECVIVALLPALEFILRVCHVRDSVSYCC